MCSAGQQLFLQSMLSKGALNEQDTRDLYIRTAEACGESAEGQEVDEGLAAVSKELKVFGLELYKTRLEDREESWYGVVNRNPDPAAKIASMFTPQELEFFNKMVKLLVLKGGVVSSGQLLNVTCDMERKLTADGAQTFLKTLTDDHWLTEWEGKYSAGPRFILELRPFLSEIYGEEVALCKMCNEPVLMGQQCDNCERKIHLVCVAILARGRSVIRCPECREEWPHEIPDIELPETSSIATSLSSTSRQREDPPAPPSKRPHSSKQRRK